MKENRKKKPIFVPLVLAVYTLLSVLLLKYLGRSSGIADGVDAASLDALGDLHVVSVLLAGGAGVLAWLLYMIEPFFAQRSPPWTYYVLPILVMAIVYFSTPS
jgi:hypothetical protein